MLFRMVWLAGSNTMWNGTLVSCEFKVSNVILILLLINGSSHIWKGSGEYSTLRNDLKSFYESKNFTYTELDRLHDLKLSEPVICNSRAGSCLPIGSVSWRRLRGRREEYTMISISNHSLMWGFRKDIASSLRNWGNFTMGSTCRITHWWEDLHCFLG